MAPIINVHGNNFDTSVVRQAPNAEDTNFILVHFEGDISAREKAQLEDLRVTLISRLDNTSFLCKYEPNDLDAIRKLPFVEHADVYHPHLKLSPGFERLGIQVPDIRALQSSLQPKTAAASGTQSAEGIASASSSTAPAAPAAETTANTEPVKISVVLHEGADETAQQIVDRLVADPNIAVKAEDTDVFSETRFSTTIPAEHISHLAAIDSVQLVEPRKKMGPTNDIARMLLNDSIYDVYADDNNTGYTGAGQIISVGDTGFDTGANNGKHPAFEGSTIGKIISIFQGGPTNDTDGHGTHVAGSAVGSGVSDKMAGGRRIRGTAPGAQLMVTRLTDAKDEWYEKSMLPILQTPFDDGARIFNESWGPEWENGWQGQDPYGATNIDIDGFVFNHQDTVICWSAGNDGIHGPSIADQAASKNVITVGSCDTTRPNANGKYDPALPTESNPFVMSPTSSKGPTKEGRIKPDVVAPGRIILSARSQAYTGKDPDESGTSSDINYMFMSGTSMACPAVAGCAAVLRQVLLKTRTPTDVSAAMIKALLVNGAVSLTPGSNVPNNDEGFGRVNLECSIAHVRPGAPGNVVSSQLGQNAAITSYTVRVDAPENFNLVGTTVGRRLRATLVWMDEGKAAPLQRVLFLKAQQKDKTSEFRYGNKGDDTSKPDIENNVQRVDWINIPAGEYELVVSYNDATVAATTKFAVAWYVF